MYGTMLQSGEAKVETAESDYSCVATLLDKLTVQVKE